VGRRLDSASSREEVKPRFRFRRALKAILAVGVSLILASVVLVLLFRWLPIPVTPLMMERVNENLINGQPIALQYHWVSRSMITDKLENAVIASEDWRFYDHNGFDWPAIEKAMKHNKHGGRIRGASTISQQTAKNVFLWPSRSWVRKGLEAYFTILIEALWSKDRIMEVYLNVVELGDGIYGVGAASDFYFHKAPGKLSSSEAALLAAVLPNPRLFQVSHPSPYIRFRQTMIQRRMPLAAETVPE
jgi:monofunctional biosynthetic peptidoglycan transglycosylase